MSSATFKFEPKKKFAPDGTFFTTPSPKVSQESCSHTTTSLTNGTDEDGNVVPVRRCTQCGMEKIEAKGYGKNVPPSHYLKRSFSSYSKLWKTQDNPAFAWIRQEWGAIRPQNREAAEEIVSGWNKDAAIMGMSVEYKCAPFELRCEKCKTRVSETYKGDLCYSCHINEKVLSMPPKKPKAIPSIHFGFLPKATIVRKEGDIWKLPAVNSPMWTSQWAYQGSAKEPYIVSQRTDGVTNGSVTNDGWACSCMNFTRNTPRTECKHILKVMMSEGKTVNKAKGAMANTDDAQLKAFKQWQMEQAAAGVSVVAKKEGKMRLFDQTSRKFR